MVQTPLTEGMHAGEYIGESAMGIGYHNNPCTVNSGAELSAGTVLGLVLSGATVTAGDAVSTTGGTVGNGAVGDWTADDGAQAGPWAIEITKASSDGGEFLVRRPDGTVDGVGAVGTAYNGGINGTLEDGSADWAVGDTIPLVVSYPDGTPTVDAWDPDATDGTQTVGGILFDNVDATGGATPGVFTRRGPMTVNGNDLVYPDGADDDVIAAANAGLLALGIRVA